MSKADDQSPKGQTNEQQAQPEFVIQRLYLKDASLESPSSPGVFEENTQPSVNLNIQTAINNIKEGLYEVTLTATVTATADNKTLFLIEAKQAGVFTIKNIPEQNIPVILNVTCPTVLFPYLRETISDLVVRANFPQFYLAPINFEALYLHNIKKQEDAKKGETTAE